MPNPISTCVFCIAVRFWRVYVVLANQDKLYKNLMRKMYAEMGCVNKLWTHTSIRHMTFVYYLEYLLLQLMMCQCGLIRWNCLNSHLLRKSINKIIEAFSYQSLRLLFLEESIKHFDRLWRKWGHHRARKFIFRFCFARR